MGSMRIGTRFTLAFVVVLFLTILLGVVSLKTIHTSVKYNEHVEGMELSQSMAGHFNTYLNQNAALVRDMILLTDTNELQSTQHEIDSLTQQLRDILDTLKQYCWSDAEITQIRSIESQLSSYQASQDIVIQMSLEQNQAGALPFW